MKMMLHMDLPKSESSEIISFVLRLGILYSNLCFFNIWVTVYCYMEVKK